MSRFISLFNNVKCAVIGAPKSSLNIKEISNHACEEAIIYEKCGLDGIIIENMFDVPYTIPNDTGPEIIAAMTRICTDVRRAVPNFPCGIQILAGNNKASIAVALCSGFHFIRAEGFVYAHVADEGIMEACAGTLLRYRKSIGAEHIFILTDIKKKHSSHAITSDLNIGEIAKGAEFFLSDGVILTGKGTGDAASPNDLKSVRNHTMLPVVIGSGVTAENVENFYSADCLIIGSYFKKSGHWTGTLDIEKILNFMVKMKSLRST